MPESPDGLTAQGPKHGAIRTPVVACAASPAAGNRGLRDASERPTEHRPQERPGQSPSYNPVVRWQGFLLVLPGEGACPDSPIKKNDATYTNDTIYRKY